MSDTTRVSEHYAHGDLLAAIRTGVAKLGKTSQSVSIDDLGPVDEFHIGGRQASREFLDQLELAATDRVLDVGCGLGGPARFTADRYGCQVAGIDLTAEYIETGRALCDWVGLAGRIDLTQGSALEMAYADNSFDSGYMMHVGMNIADKGALFREIHRVLKPGGRFGIYDVMRIGEGDLTYPVPWASEADHSHLGAPAEYRDMLQASGFELAAERDRHAFALEFFAQAKAQATSSGGPPPLGLHVLMGDSARVKFANLVAGRLAPVEMIARKPA